jgi:hypothetical protein
MSKSNNSKDKADGSKLPSVKNKTSTSASTSVNKKQETSKSGGDSKNKLPAIKSATPAKADPQENEHQDAETLKKSDVTENPPLPETPVTSNIPAVTASVVPAVVSDLSNLGSATVVVEEEVTTLPEPEPIPQNGKVTLIYEQYNEQFDIVNGSTTHENIDEVYCLSFVMPGCLIHLSKHAPGVKRQLEIEEKFDDLFFKEDPRGTYHGLEVDHTYYVFVEQEAEQLARDQAITKQRLQTHESGGNAGKKLEKDDGRVLESCSCIYGNPCVDEYGCKDWTNRFAVASKNGWKGF